MPPRETFRGSVPDNVSPTEERFRFAEEAKYSAASQLEAMDIEGITASVLFPTVGLVLMGVDGVDGVDPALTSALATAYNTWLADFLSDGKGGCSVPPASTSATSTEPWPRRAVP